MTPKGVLSQLWRASTKVKNWSYDYHLLDQVEVPCPVVSIGNLSSGGTGKTPITQKLFGHFSKEFAKIAIISRNYRAIIRTVGMVDPQHPNAALFYGDEPAWLAQNCPSARVFVGPRKYETATYAFQKMRPDLILVDDGFQHRALKRDMDLVLWDATCEDEEFLPAGRLREDFTSLGRADYVILTKTNWATPAQLEKWRNRLAHNRHVEAEFSLLLNMDWIERSKHGPVGAFAGVANAMMFRSQLEQVLQRELPAFWSFPDHYTYPPDSLAVMAKWLKDNPEGYLFTTEKDAIKLRSWVQEAARVVSVPLAVEWGKGKAEFLEFLTGSARHRELS